MNETLCKICGINPTDLSMLVCSECSNKATYQPKVILWIEGVENPDRQSGLIRLSPSILKIDSLISKDDTVVCGTWGRNSDKTVWVRLLEPVAALQDRTTLILAEIEERLKRGLSTGPTLKPPTSKQLSGGTDGKTKRAPRTPKPFGSQGAGEEAPGVGASVSASMQALRDKLRTKT